MLEARVRRVWARVVARVDVGGEDLGGEGDGWGDEDACW